MVSAFVVVVGVTAAAVETAVVCGFAGELPVEEVPAEAATASRNLSRNSSATFCSLKRAVRVSSSPWLMSSEKS